MKKLFKFLYANIPFKKNIFQFIKLFYKPEKNVYQHLHFVDKMKVTVGKNKQFYIKHYGYQVENEIFWNGIFNGWEKYSLRLWGELCSRSEVIFDIGANTGIYALLAKAIQEDAKVYAFEPVERVFQKLEANNNLNSFEIHCVKKAVSNFDGSATIYDKDTDHTYSVTVNKDTSVDKENSIAVEIETIRLETFIEQEKLPKIDLMKIDVETHEVEALEGFGKYLKRFQPTMLIEILNEEVAEGVSKLIEGIDYEFYNIDENSGIRKVSMLSKSDYYNFLVCKPEVAESLKILQI